LFSPRQFLCGAALACAILALAPSAARATNYIGSTISWEITDATPTVRYTARIAFREGAASPIVFDLGDGTSQTVVFDPLSPLIIGPPVVDPELGIETWTFEIIQAYAGQVDPIVAGFSGCCRTPTIDPMNAGAPIATSYSVLTTVDFGAASQDSPIYSGPLALAVPRSPDASERALMFDLANGSTPDEADCAMMEPTPPGFVDCSATCMASPACLLIGSTDGETEGTAYAAQVRAGLTGEQTIAPIDLLLVIVPPVVRPQCEITSASGEAQPIMVMNDMIELPVGQDLELVVRGFDVDADIIVFDTPPPAMNSGEVGLPGFASIVTDPVSGEGSGNPAQVLATVTGAPTVAEFDTVWPLPFEFRQTFGPGGEQALEAPCTITITVPANQAPVAADDPNGATDEGVPLMVDVLANDTDPEVLPLTIGLCPDGLCDSPVTAVDPDCGLNPGDCITTAEGGTARIVGVMMGMDVVQMVEYTPPAGFPAGDTPMDDSFTYRALDANDPDLADPLQSNIATVTVTVSPVGDPLMVTVDDPAVVLVVPSMITDPMETTATNSGTWTDGDGVPPVEANVTTGLFDPLGMATLEDPFGTVLIDPNATPNTWSWSVDVNDMMFTNVGFGTDDEVRLGFPDALPSMTVTQAFDLSIICPLGDANRDGMVAFSDVTAVLDNWLTDYSPGTGPGDANGDGIVNFSDVTAVLMEFNQSCPLGP